MRYLCSRIVGHAPIIKVLAQFLYFCLGGRPYRQFKASGWLPLNEIRYIAIG